MRHTMQLVQAQTFLLLGMQGVEWEQKEYALFYVMKQMIEQYSNPSYVQYAAGLGAWLRFQKRLVDRLPEGEGKTTCEAEWGKLAADYSDLVEMKIS